MGDMPEGPEIESEHLHERSRKSWSMKAAGSFEAVALFLITFAT
jgi:hypothetical protein